MDQIKKALLDHLQEMFAASDELEKPPSSEQGEVCREALKVLSGIEMREDEAEDLWKQVWTRRGEMSQKLGREVALEVALLDLLLQEQFLRFPRVMEAAHFEKISQAAMVDGHTGLYNATFIRRALALEVDRMQRKLEAGEGGELSVAFFDLDDFKPFNDTYGHLAGDLALMQFASILKTSCRKTDIAGRYGGEEFLLVLPDTAKRNAIRVAERVRSLMERAEIVVDMGEIMAKVTVSAGVATYPEDGDTSEDLIDAADRALYRAKQKGKNRVEGA